MREKLLGMDPGFLGYLIGFTLFVLFQRWRAKKRGEREE